MQMWMKLPYVSVHEIQKVQSVIYKTLFFGKYSYELVEYKLDDGIF